MTGVYARYLCCPTCRGVVAVETSETPMATGPTVNQSFRPFRVFVTGPGAKKLFEVGHNLKAGCAHSHDTPQKD